MFGLRGQELLIILVVVLLLFGAKKLPELARSLGSSAKEFRKGIEEGKSEASPEHPSEALPEHPSEALPEHTSEASPDRPTDKP
jgi:sec-independent protein translocase protein TatA